MIAGIAEHHRLRVEVAALKAELAEARRISASAITRSHNHPPELVDAALEVQREVTVISEALDEAEEELAKPVPAPAVIARIGKVLLVAAKAVAGYGLHLVDAATENAAKAIGKAIGNAIGLGLGGAVVAYLVANSDRLAELGNALLRFAGH